MALTSISLPPLVPAYPLRDAHPPRSSCLFFCRHSTLSTSSQTFTSVFFLEGLDTYFFSLC